MTTHRRIMHAVLPRHLAKVTTIVLAFIMLAPLARGAALSTPDGAALTVGYGDQVAIYGVAAYWDSLCACAILKDHGFDTRLVAQVAYWRGRQRPTAHESLWDASLTPMLRWAGPGVSGAQLFIEAGVGVRLLSATRINEDRGLGSAFQFGEIGGLGISFGERQRYELGAYVQHVSNGSIKQPNDGLTVFGVVLRAALP
jgi:Lipid A 3-O-deacylase (PagL)